MAKNKQLNSVLLEGTVIVDVDMDKQFCIEHYVTDSMVVQFIIRIGRDDLYGAVGAWLRKGKRVRIVGKLTANSNSVYVEAEHIEVRHDV